ncbi:MAG: hypothetical protein IJ678_08120, partial [Kiritimatiellae bacterium]|nr:hypothetical protein [Kiritimatiellia bacterium]
EILAFVRRRVGDATALCATGGFAAWALEGVEGVSVEPDLTLFGLGCIWNCAHGLPQPPRARPAGVRSGRPARS